MPEVLATMIRRHRVSRGAGDSPQRRSAARCVGPNVSFDETPRGLDRIEIVRIWWQPFHACAALFDVERHLGRLVRGQVIEHHDVAATQTRCQPAAHPLDEGDFIHRAPFRAQHDPAATADGSDQRQIVTPVHRSRFHVFLTAFNPRVRAAHREIGPGFIEKHEPSGILPTHPSHERRAFRRDVRTVHLARPLAFFLSTKSARRIARPKLVRVVRADGDARRLYAQHSSATVASGASRTMISSIAMSIGQRQPPPLGRGATDPVARSRATHRCSVRYPTPKSRASSWYPPSPASYAATARSRNVISYDCDMPTLKYNGRVNSSGHRD